MQERGLTAHRFQRRVTSLTKHTIIVGLKRLIFSNVSVTDRRTYGLTEGPMDLRRPEDASAKKNILTQSFAFGATKKASENVKVDFHSRTGKISNTSEIGRRADTSANQWQLPPPPPSYRAALQESVSFVLFLSTARWIYKKVFFWSVTSSNTVDTGQLRSIAVNRG